jgi:hypothetical protein
MKTKTMTLVRRCLVAVLPVLAIGTSSVASADQMAPAPPKQAPAKVARPMAKPRPAIPQELPAIEGVEAPQKSKIEKPVQIAPLRKLDTTDIHDQLPKAKLEIPKTLTMPKSIAASEKVDGIYMETPPHFKNTGQTPSYAMLYSSKESAAARNNGTPETGAPVCFMNAYPNYNSDINWSNSLGTSTSVQNYKNASYAGAPQYGTVQLVRSDRIVKESGDKLSYEIKLVLVDAETLGARVHSTQTLDFSLVDELPGKVKVWGARSDDQVIFLVRRERHEKERFFFGPLMVSTNGQHNVSGSEACPVMFTLKTGKNVSTSAVVQLETLLSIEEPDGEDEASDKPGFISSMPIKSVSPMRAFGQKEAKVRPMRIGISSSWMSQDKKPIISVSHGWAGKQRTQPI